MSLTSDDIAEIADALAASNLDELYLTGPSVNLHLRRPGFVAAPRAASLPGNATITAPGVGIFLPCHPLQTEPLAAPGHCVRTGDIVALLRIGALLRQVTAPAGGIIGTTLTDDGAVVGFGTALFAFYPDPPEAQP